MKYLIAAAIYLLTVNEAARADETWVMIGSEIVPQLLNAPKSSIAGREGIAGMGWLVDLQSIVKQGNLVFYNEKMTFIDKSGNTILGQKTREYILRIVDCKTRLIKYREKSNWSEGDNPHKQIIRYLCGNGSNKGVKEGFL